MPHFNLFYCVYKVQCSLDGRIVMDLWEDMVNSLHVSSIRVFYFPNEECCMLTSKLTLYLGFDFPNQLSCSIQIDPSYASIFLHKENPNLINFSTPNINILKLRRRKRFSTRGLSSIKAPSSPIL